MFLFLGISNAYSEICIHELCLSQKYTESPIKINHPNLPPDPGSEGKLSLLGVDVDQDGVRDDVYRYVADSYWDKPHAEFLYLKKAKAIQNILNNYTDKEIVDNKSNLLTSIMRCGISLYGYKPYNEMETDFKIVIFNTLDRYKYWALSQSLLGGNTYSSVDPSTYSEFCSKLK